MTLLNLNDMPEDSIERIMWLSGVREQVERELDEQFQVAYFEARLEQRFPAALSLRVHFKKQALRYTRRENNRRGRSLRWGDGMDSSSSAYVG